MEPSSVKKQIVKFTGEVMMAEMIVCGLSMEMEMAEEMGYVGKCIGCLYLEDDYCTKNEELLKEHKTNCEDWLVDHR